MNLAVLKNSGARRNAHGSDTISLLMNMDDQLHALHIRPFDACCSYGYAQEIVPYGMLPSGRRMATVRRLVHMWVDDMIEGGIRNFLCPMEPGIDLMVAERVIARRSIAREPLKLVACLTHPGVEHEMPLMFRNTFASLCEQADYIIFCNEERGGRRIRHMRDMLLIKHSSHMLIAYHGEHPPLMLRQFPDGIELTYIKTDSLFDQRTTNQ